MDFLPTSPRVSALTPTWTNPTNIHTFVYVQIYLVDQVIEWVRALSVIKWFPH